MEGNESPLTPFLASLAADGIYLTLRDYERVHLALQTSGPWTLTRLRDTLLALLAKDEEQYALLRRRFHEFFVAELAIEAEIAALDTQQVLTDLRQLAAQRPVADKPKPARINLTPRIFAQRIEPPKVKLGFWTAWFALLAVGLVAVGYLLFPRSAAPTEVLPPPTQVAELAATPTAFPVAQARKRLYTGVPYVADIRYEPLESFPLWQRYAGVAAFFFFAALLYGLYLWRSHKIPEDEAPAYNPDGPRHFALSSIGGETAPRLNDVTLNELADSMGYFQSSEGGHRLNVVASIQTTMRKGGTPALEFYRRHQLRSLLILEDAFAEALTWNPLARELAEGMARLGVPVTYGRFYGSPAQFKTPDGALHRLEDLEDQRQGYLLLLFTDGKNLQREQQRFVLEELAHWPMIAWLDLREPRAWDETAGLPGHYGIPIYPATPDGLLQAVRSFLTEQWGANGDGRNGNRWHGLPSQAGSRIDAHVEQLLGDALLWAQDCAMLQPVTPGLADGLRLAFHPHLPAERIERLYALPGTQVNISGLRFSHEVLRVLRSGFLARRSDTEQEAVLRFLLREIGKAEPSAEDSPAHLAWEAVHERVRLEVEQDAALARLAQLAKTSVGPAISASLENFGFREEADQKIPLRLKPNNRYAWQRLARIADSFNIPKLEAYPISWGHQLTIGLLSLLCLSYTGLGVQKYFNPSLPKQNWRVVNQAEMYALLESKENIGDRWGIERVDEIQALTSIPLHPERIYQLKLYGGGHRTANPIRAKKHQATVIIVKLREMENDCYESFPEIGLVIERCPEFGNYPINIVRQATWRSKLPTSTHNRQLMSIGLEINGYGDDYDKLQRLRNLLLETSSVDVIYRIRPDKNGNWHLNEIFAEYMVEDLGSQIEQSQLIWWIVGKTPNGNDLENSLPSFGSMLKFDGESNLSWATELEKLLSSAEIRFVTESEIAEIFEQYGITIAGSIVLIPLSRTSNSDIADINPGIPISPTVMSSQPITAPQDLPGSVSPFEPSPFVYRLRISDCLHEPAQRQQTAFQVKGQAGIVTVLSGVLDCATIAASASGSEIFSNLGIRSVDIRHDLAILSSPVLDSIPTNGLAVLANLPQMPYGDAQLIGYPYDIIAQIRSTITIEESTRLNNLLPAQSIDTLAERASPELDIRVLRILGNLVSGLGGAPLLDTNGSLLGVAHGSLQGGVSIGWAIPLNDTSWRPVEGAEVRDELNRLKATDPKLALSWMAYETQAPSTQFIKYSIRVVDAATNSPIVNARVILELQNNGIISNIYLEQTDSEGFCEFLINTNDDTRTSIVGIEKEGYQRYESIILMDKEPVLLVMLHALTSQTTPFVNPRIKINGAGSISEIKLISPLPTD